MGVHVLMQDKSSTRTITSLIDFGVVNGVDLLNFRPSSSSSSSIRLILRRLLRPSSSFCFFLI